MCSRRQDCYCAGSVHADCEKPDEERGPYGWLLQMAVFLLVAGAGIVLSHVGGLRDYLTTDAISGMAGELGAWGPLAIVVIGTVMPLLFLPRWPLAMVCGMVYGIAWGVVLASVASTAGAWVQFVMARHLLAPAAQRAGATSLLARFRIPRDRVFTALVLLRAFPLSSFVATNLLAGSMRLRHDTYLAASLLGMIPSTLLYASWGKLLKKPSPAFYALAIGMVVLIAVATLLLQRRVIRRLEASGADADTGAGHEPPAREQSGNDAGR